MVTVEEFEQQLFDTVPPVNSSVPVIYDRRDPSKAMIDESLWNYIPWAPLTVIGFLIFLNALKYWPTNQAEAAGQLQNLS